MWPDRDIVTAGWFCICPKCRKGPLYKSKTSLNLNEACPICGLDLQGNDSADGPAVFLIFILGFSLVPLALIVNHYVTWPLWVHALIWGLAAITLTIGCLRPLKAYIIALQYKHRTTDWET